MAAIYAELIIKGLRQLSDVDVSILEDTKRALIDKGYPELAQEA